MHKELNNKPRLSIWHSFFKWMGICFISIIFAILALIIFFAARFSPIIKVDGNKVEIFGGAISITDDNHKPKHKIDNKRDKRFNQPNNQRNINNKLENFI